jgi:peptide-methionine (S)-S-oxide reductase
MGGAIKNPTYREVCSGLTGHAEIIQIFFDPEKIQFDQLLEVFWSTHDPTTPDRQGHDRGTQYRSVIFFHNEAQRLAAEKSKKEVAEDIWNDPIVTEIVPVEVFYPAENYHQNYFNENPTNGYCRAVINPKMAKLRSHFAHLLKSNA